MSAVPGPYRRSPSRRGGPCAPWLVPLAPRATMSGALPAVEQAGLSICATGGSSAAHSAIASSAPSTSPEGEEMATSASTSRSAWAAMSAAPEKISSSTGPEATARSGKAAGSMRAQGGLRLGQRRLELAGLVELEQGGHRGRGELLAHQLAALLERLLNLLGGAVGAT